jgi:hypothetical protein
VKRLSACFCVVDQHRPSEIFVSGDSLRPTPTSPIAAPVVASYFGRLADTFLTIKTVGSWQARATQDRRDPMT